MLTLSSQNRTFTPDTVKKLQAVEGWCYFQLYDDAFQEIESVSEEEAFETDVIIAKIRILLYLKKWKTALGLACESMTLYPNEDEFIVQRIFALKMLDLNQRADEVMKNVPLWILRTGIVHYNLACYFLRFGKKKLSSSYIREAIELNATIKKNAEKDPDLADLWT